MEFLTDAFSFEWKAALVDFLRVGMAFLLAVPIEWERHKSERNLGLRTFPIVAMAACGFILIACTPGLPRSGRSWPLCGRCGSAISRIKISAVEDEEKEGS